MGPKKARKLVAFVAKRHGIPKRDAARLTALYLRRAREHRFAGGWWLELLDAQFLTHVGPYPRVRCGEEHLLSHLTPPPGGLCHDCGCAVGEYHVFGCDAEECSRCGGQAGWCDCDDGTPPDRATLGPLSPRPMETPRDNYDIALAGAAMGLRFVPCRPGTKVPLVKWKPFQTEAPTPERYAEWFRGTRNNIAVLTGGMVLFDCDSPEKEELVLGYCGQTPWKVRTPRGGVHLGYRRRQGVAVTNQVRIRGLPIDIRTDGGLAMVPFSATENGAYAFEGPGLVAVAELPVAKIGWTRQRTRTRTVQALVEINEADAMVRRARGYLATVEGAISGQRGHDKTFRVACVLTHKFGLCFEQAWPLFKEWNEQCEPPWSDAELAHKLRDALKKRG